MKPDTLVDAMEYIGDDLLEAADRLRTGKRSSYHWVRLASLAASVCIIAGGAFIWSRMYGFGEEENIGLPETGAAPGTTEEIDAGITETMAETIAEGGISVPETLDCSSLDVSRTKAVRLHSGFTGEIVWLTDPADIKAVTDCVLQIRCENPESSRGYYGWSYGIDLYDTAEPTEDTEPFWGGSMCFGSFGSRYLYETVQDARYYARYEMTGITTEEVDAVCGQFFPPFGE